MKYNYFLLVLFVLSVGLFSCSNGGNENTNSDKKDTTVVAKKVETNKEATAAKPDSTKAVAEKEPLGVEYTAKYVCPNHCKGSGSDKAGECNNPECGMELMENPNYKEK